MTGKEGCPCVDRASTLASLDDRRCTLLPSGDDGIQLTLGGSCVPLEYGSSKCLQHDLVYDPACLSGLGDATLNTIADEAGERVIPPYCFRPWCYVDADTCRSKSFERVFRSAYFTFESGADIFFSYSTCNSTAEDWLEVEDDILESPALGGVALKAAIPTYQIPYMFKRNPNNTEEILSTTGEEYYDDRIPWEGAYPNYLKKLVEISQGDIKNVTFTHRSRASSLVHPTSSFTASVQDIQDGLLDMAVGPFWVTAQRLKMASFSLPIIYDKTFLVIPRPGTTDSLNDQTQKVLAPFSNELWGLVLVIIVVAALLSVWFSDRAKASPMGNDRRRAMQQSVTHTRRRRVAYARLALDSFLQKGLFFCSAGVEQDEGGTLPNQLLMFGFAFFILIAVSAYVANLAAFLTLSSTDAIKTMEGAVAAGMTICAHPAIEAELKSAWPTANFYFHAEGNEFHGMLEEDYDAGKCRAMVVGWEDTGSDASYLEKLCERDLVYTDSLVAEIPIAFPVRSSLSAGLSYWIYQADRYHDTSIESAKAEFVQSVSCNPRFSADETEANDYAQISVKNMFFPIVFFATCVVLAVLLQIYHHYNLKTGRQSLIGRKSTLSLVTEKSDKSDRGGWHSRRRTDDKEGGSKIDDSTSSWTGISSWIHRRKSDGNESGMNDESDGKEDNDEEEGSGTESGLDRSSPTTGSLQAESLGENETEEKPQMHRVRFEGL